MQLMPTTANRVVAHHRGKDIDRRDLFRPAVNLGLGIAYLGILDRLFPRDLAAVAAAYNAGEEAAQRWRVDHDHGMCESRILRGQHQAEHAAQ
jgi:soluble lytic murein transglycosylase-like protein